MISIEEIKDFVQNEKYEFYSHAITEAKKDGVEPEDIIYVLLTGKIIVGWAAPTNCGWQWLQNKSWGGGNPPAIFF
ncbi:MAG: hypothetical protein WA240_03180 [Nitrospirota bacterium]